MAKISGLPLAQAADGTEMLPFVQGGVTKRLTLSGFIGAVTPFLQQWYKGDQGNPGGNVMAIGLFAVAHTLLIPAGADLVQTSGNSVTGIGQALYAVDAASTAADVPAGDRTAFVSKNGRVFRLAEQVVNPTMTGALGVDDDTDAVQAALDLGRDVVTTLIHPVSGLTLASQDITWSGPGGLRGIRGGNSRMITVTGSGTILSIAKMIGFNVDFTGSIVGNTLTVTATDGIIHQGHLDGNGDWIPGTPIDGDGVTPGTGVIEQLTGVEGGPGTYRLNKAQGAIGARPMRAIDRDGFFHENDAVYVPGAFNNVLVGLIDGSAGGGVSFLGPKNHLGGSEIRNVYTNSFQVGTLNGNGCSATSCRLIGTVQQNNIFATASFGSIDTGDWVKGLTLTDMVCEHAGDTACEIGYQVEDARIFGGTFRDSYNPPLLARDCRNLVVIGTTLYAKPIDQQRPDYSLIAIVPHHSGANFNYAARIQVKALGRTRSASAYIGGRGIDLSGSELLAYGDGISAPTSPAELMGAGVLLAGDVDDFTMIGGTIDGFATSIDWNFDAQPHIRRNVHIRNIKSTRTGQHNNLYNITPVNCSFINNYGDLPAVRDAKTAAAILAPTADVPNVALQWFGNTFTPGPLSAAAPERFDPPTAVADGLLHTTDSAFRKVQSAQYASTPIVGPPLPGTYVVQIVGTDRQIIFDVLGNRTFKRAGSDDMNDDTGFGLRFAIEAGALVAKQYLPNAPAGQVMKVTGPGISPLA
jgi:hypothetical protein